MANTKKDNLKKKKNSTVVNKKKIPTNKTNSKSKTKNENNAKKNTTKKSNYNKIQDKVLENKKNEKVKDNRKKQVKQKKQVVRKEKKVQKAKERTLKRKIVLVLLSIVIKIKYLFVKIFNGLKNGLLFVIKYIKKIGLFLKNSFLKLINKIKNHKKVDKSEKVKKEKKPKKEKVKKVKKDKKEKNKEILKEEKKDIVLINDGKNKILRSLTGRIFPTSFLKGDKKRRRTIYLKEALIISIFITVLDFIGFYNSNYFDMLHIFDNSLFNLIATVTLTLLITFISAYIIDLVVTEIFLKIRKKKGRGSK